MKLFKNQHQKEGFIGFAFFAVLILSIVAIIVIAGNDNTETPVHYNDNTFLNLNS